MEKEKNTMKLIIIGIIVLIAIIVLYEVIIGMKKEVVNNISDLKYFRFSYSNGYMANSSTIYDINCEDKCVLELKPKYVPNEDAVKVNLTNEEVNQIMEIINKYQVSKWDGFNESDKYVLDGDSFSLSIRTKDGSSISASGYMMYPKNYSSFRGEIDSMFEKYIPEELKNF